MVNCS
jgi:peptidyl-prolyl cis-trans isomerase B (cyclophilin B)